MRRLDDVMRTREDSFETDLKALYEASTSCIAMYTKKEVAASRPLLHCHQIWATGGLWVSEEAFWIFDGKEPSFFQEGVCLNWWTSLCLLNLVNACLPYLFHSSILLEFRPESVRSRLGSWKEAASQERLRFQAGFLLTPFLGLSKNGVPMGAPKSSGLSSCPSKKTAILGTPCLSKCIMDITLGVVLFWAGFFWLFWDHPFIDLGLFNSGLTSIEELESEQLKEYGDAVLLVESGQ